MIVPFFGNRACKTVHVNFAFPVQGILFVNDSGRPSEPKVLEQALLDKGGNPVGPAYAVPKMARADAHVVIDNMTNEIQRSDQSQDARTGDFKLETFSKV